MVAIIKTPAPPMKRPVVPRWHLASSLPRPEAWGHHEAPVSDNHVTGVGQRSMSRTSTQYFVLIAMILLAGCAARRPARYFVRIADGFTSPTMTENLRLAPRMLTLTEFVRVCPDMRPVARLESTYQSVELQIDERFPLAALSVVAVDPEGRAMLDVPIFIEVENGQPPALRIRSDDPDLNQGRVVALGTGTFRLRIQTLCGSHAETIIPGRVVLARPSSAALLLQP